jgi:hypothetical protein
MSQDPPGSTPPADTPGTTPTGACLYKVDGEWKCKQLTKAACDALPGDWFQLTCEEALAKKQ